MTVIQIPELEALENPSHIVRISPEIDVPVTPRVMRLIDSSPFRRLARISQLGLVSQVYPGATHTRFEHSLGVYRNGLLFLRRLSSVSEFCQRVNSRERELLIATSLLHDIGHWPFCHAIEDIRSDRVTRHEAVALNHLRGSELSDLLRRDWDISPEEIAGLLGANAASTSSTRLLASI